MTATQTVTSTDIAVEALLFPAPTTSAALVRRPADSASVEGAEWYRGEWTTRPDALGEWQNLYGLPFVDVDASQGSGELVVVAPPLPRGRTSEIRQVVDILPGFGLWPVEGLSSSAIQEGGEALFAFRRRAQAAGLRVFVVAPLAALDPLAMDTVDGAYVPAHSVAAAQMGAAQAPFHRAAAATAVRLRELEAEVARIRVAPLPSRAPTPAPAVGRATGAAEVARLKAEWASIDAGRVWIGNAQGRQSPEFAARVAALVAAGESQASAEAYVYFQTGVDPWAIAIPEGESVATWEGGALLGPCWGTDVPFLRMEQVGSVGARLNEIWGAWARWFAEPTVQGLSIGSSPVPL